MQFSVFLTFSLVVLFGVFLVVDSSPTVKANWVFYYADGRVIRGHYYGTSKQQSPQEAIAKPPLPKEDGLHLTDWHRFDQQCSLSINAAGKRFLVTRFANNTVQVHSNLENDFTMQLKLPDKLLHWQQVNPQGSVVLNWDTIAGKLATQWYKGNELFDGTRYKPLDDGKWLYERVSAGSVVEQKQISTVPAAEQQVSQHDSETANRAIVQVQLQQAQIMALLGLDKLQINMFDLHNWPCSSME